MGFFLTIGNNYGREAAAFLNWATGINNQIMGGHYWATGINYGREVVAFLSWCNWYQQRMGLFWITGNN
jgi:hypothetical protein